MNPYASDRYNTTKHINTVTTHHTQTHREKVRNINNKDKQQATTINPSLYMEARSNRPPEIVAFSHRAIVLVARHLPDPKDVANAIHEQLEIETSPFTSPSGKSIIIKAPNQAAHDNILDNQPVKDQWGDAVFCEAPPRPAKVVAIAPIPNFPIKDLHDKISETLENEPISIRAGPPRDTFTFFFISCSSPSSPTHLMSTPMRLNNVTISFRAPHPTVRLCGRCFQPEHEEKCTIRCANCGEQGHLRRECPNNQSNKCINCNSFGHTH